MDHVNNEFSLQDFTNQQNFEQFIALIRGETQDPIAKLCTNYFECEHINGCDLLVDNNVNGCDLLVDNNVSQYPLQPFVFSELGNEANGGSNNIFSGVALDNLAKVGELEEINNYINEVGEYSSATMTTGTTTSPPLKRSGEKVDRTRTLISERRRRGRMKDKLYALRSLVPNITKMDKASIIGDAALYVQDLQKQAKILKDEIATLESSLVTELPNFQEHGSNSNNTQLTNIPLLQIKIVFEMGVHQVEERGYYVRLVCNRGQGVAASLYKVIDSITNSHAHSSNLSITTTHNYLFTFSLNVGEFDELGMNLPNLKLWIAGALLNQGFDFKTSL